MRLGYQLESLWWGAAQIPAGGLAEWLDPKHKQCSWCRPFTYCGNAVAISPLWRWYGKFGWTCPAPRLELKVWPDLVRQATARWGRCGGRLRRTRVPCIGCTPRGRNCNGQSVRSEVFWQKEDIRRELWVLEGDGGKVDCSALMGIGDMGRGQGKRITVRELHGASFAAQLKFVRSLADMDGVAAMKLELPPDSLVAPRFSRAF